MTEPTNKQMISMIGGAMLLGFGWMFLSGSDEDGSMLNYHLKTMARRTIYGKYQSDRMYHEEQRKKSLEALKNHPDREAIIQANPWLVRER